MGLFCLFTYNVCQGFSGLSLQTYMMCDTYYSVLGVLWSGATSVIKGAQDTIKFLRTKVIYINFYIKYIQTLNFLTFSNEFFYNRCYETSTKPNFQSKMSIEHMRYYLARLHQYRIITRNIERPSCMHYLVF